MQYNFRKAILSLFAISLFLLGCEKKEIQEEVKTNYFTIDDTEYNLASGFLVSHGYDEDDDSYSLGLAFWSDGFTLILNNGELENIEGIGDAISLGMFTEKEELTSGTYTFQDDDSPGTLDYGWVEINYDVKEYDADLEFEVIGGTVTVLNESEIYTITLSLDLENDDDGTLSTLTGSYTGELDKIDFEETVARNGRVAKNAKEKLNGFKMLKR